jgi:zinc transport system ATP-binding protein
VTPAAVNVQDLWVQYGDKVILEGIDLTVGENDFLGIIGPNGGGKTTLLKSLLGLVKPSRGRITLFDESPERTRKLVGYVPQIEHSDPEFPATVWDVVLMWRLSRSKILKPYGATDEEVARHALSEVGMMEYAERPIGKLSGGQRQRALIARALAAEPRLLLLDEPTASVDQHSEREFWELLGDLKNRITIIVVTHDISAVSRHVDKIACLNRRLYYQGTRRITPEMWNATYGCPVDMIAHGIPHWVIKEHEGA